MKPCTITSHRIPKQPPGKGPNGRKFCRWCHNEVPPRRSSYCHEQCWRHADFNYSRRLALRRDKNTCVQCGYRYPDWHERMEDRKQKLASGEKWYMPMRLEVDHIIAVADGGTHHPDNLRTLCRGCHKKRTAEQAAERARKKREANHPPHLFAEEP